MMILINLLGLNDSKTYEIIKIVMNMKRKFVVRFNKSNESCFMIDQVILIKLLIFFKEDYSIVYLFLFLSVKYEKKY